MDKDEEWVNVNMVTKGKISVERYRAGYGLLYMWITVSYFNNRERDIYTHILSHFWVQKVRWFNSNWELTRGYLHLVLHLLTAQILFPTCQMDVNEI